MYLRFFEPHGDKDFGFVTDDAYSENDIYVTQEEHDKFFELLSEGFQFKVINRNGKNLFEIVEQYKNKIEHKKTEFECIQNEQTIQDDKITTTMLANTELFEMMLVLMSTQINLNIKKWSDFKMVEVYVTLIIEGVKTIEQVPSVIRPQVTERLYQIRLEHLAK